MNLKSNTDKTGIGWSIAAVAIIVYLIVLFVLVNSAIFLGLFRIIQWLLFMLI